MAAKLTIAVPAKGRLKDNAAALFERAGLTLRKTGHERGYSGVMQGLDGVEVAFLSAAEIVHQLEAGRVHIGITGEDLIRETLPDVEGSVEFLAPLGFGRADVVVAVPDCWIDVVRMADLEDVAAQFARVHGRRLRVATKYLNLTRRFFASAGVAGYRIVESVGATEGTPAAGTAELIVDITTTGTTLAANHLKVLEDGLILQSQAHLFAARGAQWTKSALRLREAILDRLSKAAKSGAASTMIARLVLAALLLCVLACRGDRRAVAHHHPPPWREGRCLEAVRRRARTCGGARRDLSRPQRREVAVRRRRGACRLPRHHLHTLELAAPAAGTWSLPLTLYAAPPGGDKKAFEVTLNQPHASRRRGPACPTLHGRARPW